MNEKDVKQAKRFILSQERKVNEKERMEYKKNSILSSYLIHMENESSNLLMKITTDKIFRNIISFGQFSIPYFELTINSYIRALKNLIDLLKF